MQNLTMQIKSIHLNNSALNFTVVVVSFIRRLFLIDICNTEVNTKDKNLKLLLFCPIQRLINSNHDLAYVNSWQKKNP